MKKIISVLLLFCSILLFSLDSFALDLPKLKLNDRKDKIGSLFSNSPPEKKFDLDIKKNFQMNKISSLSDLKTSSGSRSNLSGLNTISRLQSSSSELISSSGFRDLFPKMILNGDYKPWESKRRFWVAFGEMALLEFLPFSFSAYLKDWSGSTEKNWTKISFESMWHNLENGWIYDGDNFLTNFFAHPYHGNLFYNAGRTNGYNFWESTAFAMSGSAFWEQFMETWEPAFNDWVLTSLNGINLGEITYRLSTLVTDNRATGSTRTWLEIAGAIINPVRAFNRLVTGETHRNFPNPEWRMPKNLKITLGAGSRRLDENNGVNFAKDGVQEGLFEMDIIYGNKLQQLNRPFSEFSLNMQLGTSGPNLTQLTGNGNLFGFRLSKGKSTTQYFIQTLNYSYINNPGFLFGAASLNSNYIVNFALGPNSAITTNFNLALIPMGATPDDYIDTSLTEGRNYDFGPGVGVGLEGAWRIGRWNIVELRYSSGWIFTQSEPPYSKHHLHFANVVAQYPMKDYFVIGLSGGVYWRNSNYTYDPDVEFTTPIARVFFKTIIENRNETAIGQSYIQKKNISEGKKSYNWKEELSDMILVEGTYFRNLSSFSDSYNKAWGVYGGFGKQFANKFHLILKAGYNDYKLRDESGGDSVGTTPFTTLPIQIGGRYYILNNIVQPYFSFMNGINLVFQEKELNGDADAKTLVKYIWRPGFGIAFKLFKQMNLDISANYNDNFYEPEAMLTSFEYTAGLSFNLR